VSSSEKVNKIKFLKEKVDRNSDIFKPFIMKKLQKTLVYFENDTFLKIMFKNFQWCPL